MSFNLSFAGVQVNISPSASSTSNFQVSGVRHFDDGHIEAEVINFSGKIIISSSSDAEAPPAVVANNDLSTKSDVIVETPKEEDLSAVDRSPEVSPRTGLDTAEAEQAARSWLSFLKQVSTGRDIVESSEAEEPFIGVGDVEVVDSNPEISPEADDSSFEHDGNGNNEAEEASSSTVTTYLDTVTNGTPAVYAPVSNSDKIIKELPAEQHVSSIRHQSLEQLDISDMVDSDYANLDLRLHELCASDEVDDNLINDLFELLRSDPKLASVEDDDGNYPAHVFAKNESFIYGCRNTMAKIQQFVLELYAAYPDAFLTEGLKGGQIPFADAIADWIEESHLAYTKQDNRRSLQLVADLDLHDNSMLCVRGTVQRLLELPTHVTLPIKVMYSFEMLSLILDELSSSTSQAQISARRVFWSATLKKRNRIVQCVARLPFLVRTILLIKNKDERDAVLRMSIVRNVLFCPESVDLWLVALLSGEELARSCATAYLVLISELRLTDLYGRKHNWDEDDMVRFYSMRGELYDEVGRLAGLMPCMLHLGPALYEVVTSRVVRHIVGMRVGKPVPVYLMFFELFLILILMTSYRIIVEMVYAFPSEEFLSQVREFWVLAFTIAVYFGVRDVYILLSLASTEKRVVFRYARKFSNLVGYVTTASVISMLSVLYVNNNIEGQNYAGIVSGLLWWKLLLHMKGISESLSTLVNTIVQLTVTMKYFIFIFLGTIFFFADMVDIIKKTSGECEDFDAEEGGSLEAFCSLTPPQAYLAMYAVMIGGVELESLEGSSAIVTLLFVAASFSGVIILVNILIAIVTAAYEKAQEQSCVWFARARLEAAVQQVAREKIHFRSAMARKFWRYFSKAFYTSVIFIVEFFLIKCLISCSSLTRNGILPSHYPYVYLILCAILYNMFVVTFYSFIFAKFIDEHDGMRWLRDSWFHRTLHNACPVCWYLSRYELSNKELNMDDCDEEEHPLSHDVFLAKQEDFENNVQEALKASEERILGAMKSMMVGFTHQK